MRPVTAELGLVELKGVKGLTELPEEKTRGEMRIYVCMPPYCTWQDYTMVEVILGL